MKPPIIIDHESIKNLTNSTDLKSGSELFSISLLNIPGNIKTQTVMHILKSRNPNECQQLSFTFEESENLALKKLEEILDSYPPEETMKRLDSYPQVGPTIEEWEEENGMKWRDVDWTSPEQNDE